MTLEESLQDLPPGPEQQEAEKEYARKFVERMERELGEEYLPTAGMMAGGLLIMLSRYVYNIRNGHPLAHVFSTNYFPVTAATMGWWIEIEKMILTDRKGGDEVRIARVLTYMYEMMSGTIFSEIDLPASK